MTLPQNPADLLESDPGGLPEVQARLEPFDVADLLKTAGALELLPTNAERFRRIQAFAHAAMSLPHREGLPRISAPRLREILNGPELGAFAHGEDPFPNAFIEELPFCGGSYQAIPGATSVASYVFRQLTRAVFKSDQMRHFARAAYPFVLSCLKLNDLVVTRSGLNRHLEIKEALGGPIVVPSAQHMATLKAAVTFSRDEMEQLFGQGEIRNRPWNRIVSVPGSLDVNEFSFDNSPLVMRPVAQIGNTFVVVCPEALLTAVNHHIIALAVEAGATAALADAYGDAVMVSVVEAMRYLDVRTVTSRMPESDTIPGTRECLFQCDSDKLIYVLVVTDQLGNFDLNQPYGGQAATPGLEEKITKRVRAVEEALYRNCPELNDLLCLLVHESMGRVHGLAFGDVTESAHFALFPAHDFVTFSLFEGGNRLALWRFVEARDRVRERQIGTVRPVLPGARFRWLQFAPGESAPDCPCASSAWGSPSPDS